MYLKAISIGDAVPRTDFDAQVHSTFPSAINLRLKEGNSLLTLVTCKEADLPQGIRVDTPKGFSFEIFNAGEQMTCRNNILCLGSLTIELLDAGRWKCDLPSLQADLTNVAVATAWHCVWDTLNLRQIQWKAEIIGKDLFRSDETIRTGVLGKASKAMRGLLDATRRLDLTAVSSLDTLIGLGSGLTPSGDDLLVGYMAGLWCSVLDKRERIQFSSSLGKAVMRLSHQTNDISRAYLYHASQGQVSSPLADLAGLICQGENSDRLLNAAQSAMQIGHTSGMDTITGLLIGLMAWENQETARHLNSTQ